MKIHKLYIYKFFIAFFLLCTSAILYAHDNNVVHPGLTNAGISSADIPEITARGFFDIGTDNQCSFIDEGSVKEDAGASSCDSWNCGVWGDSFCSMSGTNWMNHCYNPINGNGWWIGGEDTLTYCSPIWSQALADYSSSNFDNAYFALGRVCHLLEDMTSPAHAHDDVHWPEPEDFENWGAVNFQNYDFTAMNVMPFIPSGMVTLPNSAQVEGHSIEGFIHSLAKFAYDLSSFQGHIREDEGSQPDSEFKRMFPTLHFYDGGWFGDNYWEIDNIGFFEKIDFVDGDEWWPCDDDYHEYDDGTRQFEGNFYVENSAGDNGNLTPAVFEKTGIYEANPNTKKLLQIYGDLLFPETVSYLAGLYYVFTDTIPGVPDLYFPENDTFIKGTGIKLFWKQARGANNYHLQVSSDSTFNDLIYDSNVGDITSIELTDFPDNGTTNFYWRVKGGNPAGWSSYSGYWSFISGCMRGDFDSDCDADFNDLNIFVSHWLDTDCNSFGLCEGTDLVRSTDIDFEDYSAFAEVWQTTTPIPPSTP